MAIVMDGKALAAKIRAQIADETETLKQRGVTPCLAVILAGEDPASQIYVRNKRRACDDCGFLSEAYTLPADVSQDELLALVRQLNARPEVDGILIQQPLPKGLDAAALVAATDPEKDVDCFCNENCGRVLAGDPYYLPCTPAGVMALLREYQIDPRGKECVVVGRSNIVGKPMGLLLLAADGTVTVCHSKTRDLPAVCRRADVLVSAVGKARFITADMVKEGCAVVDVGMNRGEDGKLCGDVDYAAVSEKACAITPVPGGVGPMTIAMLMQNTLRSARRRAQKQNA